MEKEPRRHRILGEEIIQEVLHIERVLPFDDDEERERMRADE